MEKNNRTRFGGLRNKALERDNWACVKCGMTQEQQVVLFGRSLSVDHIDGEGRNSKKPNNSLENLQTLCQRCHSSKDHYWTKELKKKGISANSGFYKSYMKKYHKDYRKTDEYKAYQKRYRQKKKQELK